MSLSFALAGFFVFLERATAGFWVALVDRAVFVFLVVLAADAATFLVCDAELLVGSFFAVAVRFGVFVLALGDFFVVAMQIL